MTKKKSVKTPISKTIAAVSTQDFPLDTSAWNKTLFEALLDARDKFGGKRPIIEDTDRQPLTYDRLILGATIFGAKLEPYTSAGERVGVMLPNVVGVAAVFYGLQSIDRVPAMLNFSAGFKSISAACRAGRVESVVTSKLFVKKAGLEDLVKELEAQVKFIWTEDIRASISLWDKVRGVLNAKRARSRYAKRRVEPSNTAVLLFTSGSEGVPKGVVLSHANILSNCEQFLKAERIDENRAIFNALPTFHSFGLTVGLVAPVVVGMRSYFYPSPLHYKQIPAEIKASGCDILIGSDTFASGWGRAAKEDDFENLTLVVLGAERVKDATFKLWKEKFGISLLEGYGVTETSPALAANSPEFHRHGTVGRLMPGMHFRLEPIPGLEHGGRLHVKGPNVMRGYMRYDAPGLLEPPTAGWHDTGDIVAIDDKGYVSIRGRLKRFAKIAGEMVSLAVVENCASAVWPDNMHAAAILPDPKKGEQVILVTDRQDAPRGLLLSWAQSHGVPEIAVPKKIVVVDEIPVLGTGKIDFLKVKTLAEEGLEALAAKKAEPEPVLSKRELKKREAEERAEKKRLEAEAKEQAAKAEKSADAEETTIEEATEEPVSTLETGDQSSANDDNDPDEIKNAAE